MNWRGDVYKKTDIEDKIGILWPRISANTKKEDDYRCKACLRKFSSNDLSVHHIIPRSSGGEDSPENLITLCLKCHDEIEGLGLSRAEIVGYFVVDKVSSKKQSIQVGRNWQEIVYGGCRRNA